MYQRLATSIQQQQQRPAYSDPGLYSDGEVLLTYIIITPHQTYHRLLIHHGSGSKLQRKAKIHSTPTSTPTITPTITPALTIPTLTRLHKLPIVPPINNPHKTTPTHTPPLHHPTATGLHRLSIDPGSRGKHPRHTASSPGGRLLLYGVARQKIRQQVLHFGRGVSITNVGNYW